MKLSIITAVYNNEKYIRHSVESVLSQSYNSIEYIVIDGDSTDKTKEILSDYSDQINILVSEPDNGIYDALNKGIALATGDVVGLMHSDDEFNDTEVLAKVADRFSDISVDGVYGDLVYVDQENTGEVLRYWRSQAFSKQLISLGWMPPHPTLYLRRSIYEELGLFDTAFKIAADYDFVLRVLTKSGINIKYIPEVMVKMRMGGASNRSLKNLIQKSKEDYMALKKNRIGGIYTLGIKNISKIPQFFQRGSHDL